MAHAAKPHAHPSGAKAPRVKKVPNHVAIVMDGNVTQGQESFGHRIRSRCWMRVRKKLIAKVSASRIRLPMNSY